MIWDDHSPRREPEPIPAPQDPEQTPAPQGPERIPAPDPRPFRGKARIRFRKDGALRFVSHNDLLRIWERLLRRAELPVRSSEGFNPRPRLSSPLALAVGMVGAEEVLEIELTEPLEAGEIARRLGRETVAGLGIVSVTHPEAGTSSAAVAVEYRCPLPHELERPPIAAAIAELLQGAEHLLARRTPGKPDRRIDIRPWIEDVRLTDEAVWFRCKVEAGGTARPDEVLNSIGLAWLPKAGAVITRERVELASDPGDKARARETNSEQTFGRRNT